MSQQNEKNPQALTLLKKQNELGENALHKDNLNDPDRLDVLTDIICTARRQLGYNPLPPKELDLWATDWAKVVRSVPTEYLEEAFTQAMENHKDGPFAAHEITQAWNAIKGEQQHRMIHQKPIVLDEQTVKECERCHGGGWERVSQIVNGRTTTAVRRCDCAYSKVVNLSSGVPAPTEFIQAREKLVGDRSMPKVEMPRVGAGYWD